MNEDSYFLGDAKLSFVFADGTELKSKAKNVKIVSTVGYLQSDVNFGTTSGNKERTKAPIRVIRFASACKNKE